MASLRDRAVGALDAVTGDNDCRRWQRGMGGVSPEACQLKKGCVFSPATGGCELDNLACDHLQQFSDGELAQALSLLDFGSSQSCQALLGVKKAVHGQLADALGNAFKSFSKTIGYAGAGRTYREEICDCAVRLYPQLGRGGLVILVYAIKNIVLKFFDREFFSWLRSVHHLSSRFANRLSGDKSLYLEFLLTRGRIVSATELEAAAAKSAAEIKRVYIRKSDDLDEFQNKTRKAFQHMLPQKVAVITTILTGANTIGFRQFVSLVRKELPVFRKAYMLKSNRQMLEQAITMMSADKLAKLSSSVDWRGALSKVVVGAGRGGMALGRELFAARYAFAVFWDIVKDMRTAYRLANIDVNKHKRKKTKP